MKQIANIICFAIVCAFMACNDASTTNDSIGSKSDSGATANTAAADETPMLKDTAELFKAWMAHGKPGDIHAEMAKDNGVWDAEITHWMTADVPQPEKSTGTATNKMIMEGRVQQSTFKGNMGGYPFEGMSMLAYDNSKKAFINTWIDNMGTGIMVMEGKYDPSSQTTNLTGTCADPRTGKECKVRQTFKKIDDNTQHMEMFMTYPGGKEYKSMEITYKRKK